jgi:DMSO/TMAO reductase YedYZ molybdopterin-dependent catalytic subunit
MAMLFDMFGRRKSRYSEEEIKRRLPPGQSLTEKWPVLHYGSVSRRQPANWDFRVWGLVENPLKWNYEEFLALGHTQMTADIHCVTRWSRFDTAFEGVPMQAILDLVRPKPEARFVMVHADNGFTTNVPLADLQLPNIMFANRADGEDLEPEHGWPMRLVVPHLYFWKSAKWVRGMEFMAEDAPGFWEDAGYHMRGDPWKEERYGW